MKKSSICLVLAAVLPLASCSGVKSGGSGGGGGGGGTGNATLSITLYDTPPSGIDLLSFTLPIAGIGLTPSSGSQVAITPAVSQVEATHLQTDSALIVDAFSVAAGSYTALNVTLGPTTASSNIFINTSGSSITYTLNGSSFTCNNGAVCFLPAGALVTIPVSLSLTLSANQSQWIGLNLNLSNAITTTGGLSVDFSQANVLTAVTSPRTGIPSGSVDTIEDFMGTVTAYSAGSSITVQSPISSQRITATLTNNTQYDTPLTPNTNYSACGAAPSCIKVGSTVSLDATLSASGTLTATEVDVLDATSTDEIEGIIYPNAGAGNGVYALILADKGLASSSSLSSNSITYGTAFCVTNMTSANAFVDTKTLNPASTGFVPSSFPGLALLTGQRVRVQVSNVVTSNTTACPQYTAAATNILLRWSRLVGTASTVSGSLAFTFNPPSYIRALDTNLVPPLPANNFSTTVVDGIADTSSIPVGSTIAIRALFQNSTQPTFAVAKVRVP